MINAQLRGNNPGGCAIIVVARDRFSFAHESDNYDCARRRVAIATNLGIQSVKLLVSKMTNTQLRGNNSGGCAIIVVARDRFSFAHESDNYDCARGNIATDTILGIQPFELLEMSNVQLFVEKQLARATIVVSVRPLPRPLQSGLCLQTYSSGH
jgi:hypothetical protein